jgi:hypothetical protein
MDSKSLLKSRTFWLNVALAVVSIAGLLLDHGVIPERYLSVVSIVFAIANILLRVATNQPVHVSPAGAKAAADELRDAINKAEENLVPPSVPQGNLELENQVAKDGATFWVNSGDQEQPQFFELAPPAGQPDPSTEDTEVIVNESADGSEQAAKEGGHG